jgi:pilus assembly protein CpaC
MIMLNINPSKLLKTVSALFLGYTLQAGADITTSAQSRHLTYQVPMNKSLLINLDRNITKSVLGNPDVADITLLSPRQLLIRGHQIGGTNATLWDSNNHVAMVVEVEVAHNLDGIKQKLYELMPKESIQVRNADRCIVLSGEVSNLTNMDYAMKIASGYVSSQGGGGGYGSSSGCGFVSGGGGGGGASAGGNQNIINMMHVGGEQQVMLEVKVAEVSSTLARALSLTARASSTTQQSGSFLWTVAAGAAGAFSGAYVAGNTLFNWSLDFSRNTSLATVLAEPNLTTLSGKKAFFLSGGEFPYTACVAGQGTTGIVPCTVNFKNFGVGVEFTPVVLDSNRINLTTHVSVSALDNVANEVVTQGLQNTIIGTNPVSINLQPVPSLNLREATSTIELADGQTMSIAGLISVNQNNTQSQTPGLADIPGLGSLFNNRTSQKDKKELVILVTPHLAKPVPPDQIKLPTDYYVAPDDIEFYLLGRMEARKKPVNTAQAPVFDPTSGGTTGRFGHQIYNGDSP